MKFLATCFAEPREAYIEKIIFISNIFTDLK